MDPQDQPAFPVEEAVPSRLLSRPRIALFIRQNKIATITAIFVIAYTMSAFCMDFFAFVFEWVFCIFLYTPVVLFGLFLVNLVGAVFCSGRRVVCSVMSVLIVAAFFGSIAMHNIIGDAQTRWFLRGGIHEYDKMVEKIYQNRSVLSSEGRSLDDIVGRTNVSGVTNSDGSLIISFLGRGGRYREEYVYYSGDMVVFSWNTNVFHRTDLPGEFYSHITNHWYMKFIPFP